jgi:hypothetical protein
MFRNIESQDEVNSIDSVNSHEGPVGIEVSTPHVRTFEKQVSLDLEGYHKTQTRKRKRRPKNNIAHCMP